MHDDVYVRHGRLRGLAGVALAAVSITIAYVGISIGLMIETPYPQHSPSTLIFLSFAFITLVNVALLAASGLAIASPRVRTVKIFLTPLLKISSAILALMFAVAIFALGAEFISALFHNAT